MSNRILVFYGSYRSDRKGIRLATYAVSQLQARGETVDFIDAKAVGLPMLDRMYKEYPKGTAPPSMEQLAQKIIGADAFVFVAGEYNWGLQPGLKNLTDHFLEEWFWRPAAIISYSGGRLGGARSNYAWHPTLSEMGTPGPTRPTIARRVSTICRRPCLVGGSCQEPACASGTPLLRIAMRKSLPAAFPCPSARAHPGQRWRRNRRARL